LEAGKSERQKKKKKKRKRKRKRLYHRGDGGVTEFTEKRRREDPPFLQKAQKG